jgi:hypothetical protein
MSQAELDGHGNSNAEEWRKNPLLLYIMSIWAYAKVLLHLSFQRPVEMHRSRKAER